MKIGVDASCWLNRRGYGRFTRELLKAMISTSNSHKYIFFIDSASHSVCNFPEGVTVINIPVKIAAAEAASYSSYRSIRDIYNMGRAVSKETLDIMFYPSVYSYFPVFSSVKKVVTIHDVIPEIYPDMVFPNYRAKLFWKMKTWVALLQTDLVLTVSEYSKKGIIEHLKIEADRILVTCEAANSCFRRKSDNGKLNRIKNKYGISESDRYFLYVGGIGPHKNLNTLITAFNILIQRVDTPVLRLLIVGDFERDAFWMDTDIRKQAKDTNNLNGILFSGYVPDDYLSYLYSGAEALVLPSFSEGFGLPALEAMACGTSVIASETTSLPEIVADAGLFFNPHSSDQLAECMEKVWMDSSLRIALGTAGLRRAKSYSWQNAALTVLKAMKDLVE